MQTQSETNRHRSSVKNASTSPQGYPFSTILGVAAIIFAIDQASKFLVITNLAYGESWSPILALNRIFKFTFITNTGAAFGMLPQFGNIFTVVALVVIFAIITLHNYLPTENFWVRLSLGLQLGGAMGNVLDRLVRGYVVDFVDIGFWPIFNVADLAIVLGVMILAYHLWDEEESDSPPEKPLAHLSEERNFQ